MSLLVSALAKGYFAISEEGVHASFPYAQAVLSGKLEPKAAELPKDTFERVVLDDEFDDGCEGDITISQDDEYTGRIAVMRVTGVMMHYGGMCSYGTEDYAARINEYAADESIAGLIILADTPGGQVDGIETLRLAVQSFRAQKPLLTLVNDGSMASGGVWAFIGSTEVYAANMLCMLGSVGVMATLLDIRKALEMNGIEQIIIRAPQSVDKNKDVEDALNGKKAALLAELKFICDRFLNVVTDDRADKLTSDEWKTGKMFFAEDAQRIGLIDGIKNYTEVVARMQQLIAQNQDQNKMFGNKLPKVAALKGVETITAENLEAANEEIEAFGIKGVTLCLDSEIEQLTAVEGQLTTANNTIAAHVKTIGEKDAKIAALQAKVDAKPGSEPVSPGAERDNIQPTAGTQEAELTSVEKELRQMYAMHSTN
ncbi:serine protease, ClpP class [Mucilaginibacter gossypiicola]|uniref:Serine protease, ClpP class n=1 Tax=Mucilaginibacter gossypiicola TaxID=551995 RepID=A0A1H8A583_9SPHI|nr:S49 family peptidase [Mucilaginibacter gossypiicola]SEM66062.1 serine protease, ClpP class [Mucilaginibacter gossypiicola]